MLKGLLSLFLQSNCRLCERSANEEICQYCQKQLRSFQYRNPSQFWQGDLPFFVWGNYEGKLKRAIADLKYNHQPQLGELMGVWLAEAWLQSPLATQVKKLLVIPIPLHRQKLQERGFNQTELIAKGFCQVTGYPLHIQGLERVRYTQPMFALKPLEREKNIKNAFQIGKNWQPRYANLSVLLLDDIYTTGTTAREATKVLSSHGISLFGVAAIASSQKPLS